MVNNFDMFRDWMSQRLRSTPTSWMLICLQTSRKTKVTITQNQELTMPLSWTRQKKVQKVANYDIEYIGCSLALAHESF